MILQVGDLGSLFEGSMQAMFVLRLYLVERLSRGQERKSKNQVSDNLWCAKKSSNGSNPRALVLLERRD